MNRLAGVMLALLLAGAAQAEDLASTVYAGAGVAFREPSADAVTIESDTGTLLHLSLASHYEDGVLVRVDYAYTLYDALLANGAALAKDITQHDVRGGLFHAPFTRGPVAWRVGGGYVWARESYDDPEAKLTQRGGFLEGGVELRLGERVRLDLAGVGLKLEGDGDYDAEGAEGRIGLIVDASALDLTVGARYVAWQRDAPFDEDVLELRVGFGGAWGYPENRW